jgi:hypothetical protein
MTDMRATERLLEVIGEGILRIMEEAMDASVQDRDPLRSVAAWTVLGELVREMEFAIVELCRRGDTLVRAEDLRLALENDHDTNRIYPMGRQEGKTYRLARERLENALGGKMR